PRKLIRKAAVIMAYLRSKSSEKFRSRRVWGQRPGRPDNCNAVFLWLSSAKAGERHSEASRKAALKIFTKTSQKMQRFCIFFL
ncbi:MAG: hypothetical protein UC961_07850, partial [Emergencia sp.]|nr:hypothetical protein [Emergencia sp.]